MSLTLVDRYHPWLRKEQQAAIDLGKLKKQDELELLEQEQLYPLAKLSLLLFVVGGACFVILNIAAYSWRNHGLHLHLTFWGVVPWLLINSGSYVIVLVVHELIHGIVFLFWGGRPYFGTRLPLALYCGAKNQLFRRNHYLVVGLAPFVVITLFGIAITIVAPALASYILFATIGNFSGAAGDLWVSARLLRLPATTLVEDTSVGYRAWSIDGDTLH